MGHDRKPHTRRYPIRSDGTRKPGRVSVSGAYVGDGSGDDGGAACGCCLIALIGLGAFCMKTFQWSKELFEALFN